MSAPEFERVLGEHASHVGPITGYWKCHCGAQSDNTQACKGGPEPFDRRMEYRAHLAAALRTEVARWLADEGTRERVAQEIAGIDGDDISDLREHAADSCRRASIAALAALAPTDTTADEGGAR